jgi:hypothetical protein
VRVNGNGLYHFTLGSYKQACRDQDRLEARIDAAACDCWKVAGPICAACQRVQIERQNRTVTLTLGGFEPVMVMAAWVAVLALWTVML